MHERKTLSHEIDRLEQTMRELEIRYEQYFAGVEKREPMKERDDLARRLRRMTNRRMIQTDLKFRLKTLSTRYHSYSGYWDRILRLMDEGRYSRQTVRSQPRPQATSQPPSVPDEVEAIYNQLLEARQRCNAQGPEPDRQQLSSFLAQPKEKIREKFGDRAVEFRVELEGNRPRIKVRAKK